MAVDTEVNSPGSLDIAGAVELMTDAAPPEAPGDQDQPGEDRTERLAEEAADTGEEEAGNSAPEFWNAEDKAAWSDVPESVRPLLHKYERQRIAFVNERAREAAQARDEALRVAREAGKLAEQAAAWWQQNGPVLHKAFSDKWSQIDWKALAEKDPEEVGRLVKQRQEEEALLAEARRRGEADVAAARERAQQELLEARRAEHAKLAAKLPEFFGPDRARATYEELARFLVSKGIAADRIAAVHEAPIVELALSAMRFEKAQRALHRRQNGDAGRASSSNSAKATPTRIAPGPATSPGNRTAEAARQVSERFRRSGGASIADAAELIRLNDL
jgi:hypothetical protein